MKNFLAVIITFISLSAIYSKEEKLSKTIDAKGIQLVNIESKYGKIIIENSKNPEILVNVVINAQSNKEESIEKMLSNVSVSFDDNGGQVNIKTNFGSFFSFMKFTNKLFSNGDFSIDYYIKMPKDIALDISLDKGDIVLFERDADVKLTHNSGYISSQTIHGKSTFDLRDSHIKISQTDSLFFNIRSGSLVIEKSNSIKGESYNSNFQIGQVGTFDSQSMRDTYSIQEIGQTYINSTLSDIVIDKITTEGIFSTSYGSLKIKRIMPEFEEVKVTGKGANIGINIENTATNIAINHHSSTKIDIPDELGLRMKFGDEKNEFITTGTLGIPTGMSQILINIKGGELHIR